MPPFVFSVKTQLLSAFILLTTVILLIMGFLMVQWYNDEQLHRLDTFLDTEADGIVTSLATYFEPDPPPKVLTQQQTQDYIDAIQSYFSFRLNKQIPYKTTLLILGPNGEELAYSNRAIELGTPSLREFGPPYGRRTLGGTTEIVSYDGQGTAFRMITTGIFVNKLQLGSLRLACLMEPVNKASTDFTNSILVVLSAIAIINGLLGALFITRALRPVRRMSQDVALITEANLHQRIVLPPGRDELGELAQTFNSMLERIDGAYRFQEQLVADLSHQLRTPLAIMRGSIELAIRKARQPGPLRSALEDSLVDIDRMGSFLETMLQLARLDSRNFHLTIQKENLLGLVWTAVDEFSPLWIERQIRVLYQLQIHGQVAVTCDHHSPALRELLTDPALEVPFDRFQLFQVVVNILNNAWRHSPPGGEITVGIATADHQGDQYVLTIQNQGDPIPEAKLGMIFERFVRGDEGQRAADGVPAGFGLGLSIARSIIQLHRGSIRAYNPPGGGAGFEIVLPMAGV